MGPTAAATEGSAACRETRPQPEGIAPIRRMIDRGRDSWLS
jgi:hypothetical protein